jgi:hypothetical protein
MRNEFAEILQPGFRVVRLLNRDRAGQNEEKWKDEKEKEKKKRRDEG